MGQILQSSEPTGSVRTTAYRGVPERLVQHSMDQVPRVRQNARVINRSGSGNPDHCNRPDMLCKEEEPSREQEQVKKHVVMVGSWPCMVSSKVHIDG
jgi:hypothetical protein